MNTNGMDPNAIFCQPYQRLMEDAQTQTEAFVDDAGHTGGMAALMGRLYETAEREIEFAQAEAVRKGSNVPACTKGCFYCCHQVVGVVAPEVFALAKWIRANWTELEIDALKDRITGYRQTLSGLKGTSRLQPLARCPLLVDGVCSIHPARPLVCRASNSTDVSVCIAAYQSGRNPAPPPFLHTQRSAGRSIRLGLRLGLARRKMPGDIIELAVALGIALEEPDAEERWLQGEDVFAAAESPLGPSSELADILQAQDETSRRES